MGLKMLTHREIYLMREAFEAGADYGYYSDNKKPFHLWLDEEKEKELDSHAKELFEENNKTEENSNERKSSNY
jgi:hypothetical protein